MIELEQSRILYLAGGIVFLIVALVDGAWWEFSGGDVSKPVLYFGISPFRVEARLLGSEFFEPSPLLKALLLSARLLAILWSTTIIIGAIAYRKPWSSRLVNINPFTTTLGFIILLIIGVVSLPSLMPAVTRVVPNLVEILMPYSTHWLTINLYPVTHIDGTVSLSVVSGFTIQFWLALVSGVLCLAGAMVRRREIRLGKPIHRQGFFEDFSKNKVNS